MVEFRIEEDKMNAYMEEKNIVKTLNELRKGTPVFTEAIINVYGYLEYQNKAFRTQKAEIYAEYVETDKGNGYLCHMIDYVNAKQQKFFTSDEYVCSLDFDSPLESKISFIKWTTPPNEEQARLYIDACKILIYIREVCLSSRNKRRYLKEYERHKLREVPENKGTEINLIGMTVKFTVDNRDQETREYTRHTEAWEVRGHERHYKSGKVVMIKPYTKGNGKVKDTKYKIGAGNV